MLFWNILLESSSYLDSLDASNCFAHDKRVAMLRQSIIETFTRPATGRFTIYRLLNRVFFSFDQPLVFALLKKDGRNFIVNHLTPRDPLNSGAFEAALRQLGMKQWILPDSISVRDSVVSMFGTDVFVLPLRVKEPAASAAYKRRKITFEPLTSNDTGLTILKSVFSPLTSDTQHLLASDPRVRDVQISRYMENLFQASKVKSALRDDPSRHPAPTFSTKLLDVSFLDVSQRLTAGARPGSVLEHFDSMLEREISLISSSTLLTTDEDDVPNFLIFRKQFTRQTRRVGEYYYDCPPFLPSASLEKLVNHYNKKGDDRLIDKARFPHEETDEWIRLALERSDISEISRVVQSPLSPHVRSFVDYVMFTGTALVYRDPFSSGYLGWIENLDSYPNPDVQNELRRFAIIHYYLLAGAPEHLNSDNPDFRPSVLLLPVRISGAVCMVSASVVDSSRVDQPRTTGDRVPLVTLDEFQYRTYLYHAVIREFESRVRRKVKEAYLASIGDLFSDTVHGAIEDIRLKLGDKELSLSASAAAKINSRIDELARYCPYDPVVFEFEKYPKAPEKKELLSPSIEPGQLSILGFARGIDIALQDRNPFFDRARLDHFLNPADVRSRLEDVINARLGAWSAYYRAH